MTDPDLWPPPAEPSTDKDLQDALAMSAAAEEAGMARCIDGEAVFFMPTPKALVPGHIYSEAGRDEFHISGMCEFHFDQMFADESCDCGQECCIELRDGNEMGNLG